MKVDESKYADKSSPAEVVEKKLTVNVSKNGVNFEQKQQKEALPSINSNNFSLNTEALAALDSMLDDPPVKELDALQQRQRFNTVD